MRLSLGIDAGGTYTDSVLWDLDGRAVIAKAKSPTTYHDLVEGVVGSINQLPRDRFAGICVVSLSTTLATNATVEGRGAPVGLLLMPYPGFDPVELGIEPVAVVPGRMSILGRATQPVDAARTADAIDRFVHEQVGAVAVSGYAGVINPTHELAVKDMVVERTGLPVVCGHELSSKLNFLNRARTAVLNARLLPFIQELLDAVKRALLQRGIDAPLMIVKGDGTLVSESLARQRPIETVLSGPAASVVGARELAGATDAVVIDVGGTTTDIAILDGGHVALNPEGARLGGWQTSVEAVDMHTSGLGGDSYLQIGRRMELAIGPQRVVPLAFLLTRHPELHESLGRAIARGPNVFPHTPFDFFTLVGGSANGFQPTRREREILGRLTHGPASRGELAEAFDYLDPSMVRTERLERRRLIQRSALTPTDVFHVTGQYRVWDADGSRRALVALADWMNTELDELTERVRTALGRTLAERTVVRVVRDRVTFDVGPSPSVNRTLLDALLDGEPLGGLELVARLDRPIVGLGAPVGEFVPAAARRLGTRAVIPEHADVANAVGAAASKIVVRQRVRIAPDPDGLYALTTPAGPRAFESLSDAERFATDMLTEWIRQRAEQAGTSEQTVQFTRDPRWARIADGSDYLVELVVEGLLVGHPISQ